MKPGLQLRVGQQITMTPQLQQAIRLLQLSTLDLQAEVQQVLESNIMLESAEDGEDADDLDETGTMLNSDMETPAESLQSSSNEESNTAETEDSGDSGLDNAEIALDSLHEMPDDLPVDSQWDDIYDAPPGHHEAPENNGHDYIGQAGAETLHAHLQWQLELTPFSPRDRAIAGLIIEALDDKGYLPLSLEEIQESLGGEVELDEIAAVLKRVQHFDPPGVAARDVRECLLLQLEQLGSDTPWLPEARKIVADYLDLLAERDFPQLMRKTKLSREQLQEVIALVQSLEPRPGARLETEQPQYLVPDVFVRKLKGKWTVELNIDIVPRLRINSHYASLISRAHSRTDVDSLKTHLQEARWFIKSLKSRHETLLKVTRCIMDRQSAFLEYGEEAMKPLVLHDIAEELEMHESTISRVTTQKFVHTPRGIFELKYFFSSHVSTDSGGECSSTAIRALIKKLISAENAAKPLSDSKIAQQLLKQGIKVARRTVAKYREAMLIPPSNERKCLA